MRREPSEYCRETSAMRTARGEKAPSAGAEERESYVSEKRDVEFADFTHGAGNISGNCAG